MNKNNKNNNNNIVMNVGNMKRKMYLGLAACFLVLIGIRKWNHHKNHLIDRGVEFEALVRKRDRSTVHHGVKKQRYFPALQDAQEMSRLSLLVYMFRDEMDDGTVCKRIQTGNYTLPNVEEGQSSTPGPDAFPDLYCHWYYHDRESQGTQVMIVSSAARDHLTVVFAGTDDLQTSLVDSDVRWEVFGDGSHWKLPSGDSNNNDDDDNNKTNASDATASDADRVKVHAGFDHAVFANGLMDEIVHRLEHLRQHDANGLGNRRLFCTGHSLGAAAAVLTTIALTEYYHPSSFQAAATATMDGSSNSVSTAVGRHWWDPRSWWPHRHRNRAPKPDVITTINFGCPRMGNMAYRNFISSRQDRTTTENNNINKTMNRMQVWRIVLGWDLVPRLPDFFQHGGHTLQLSVEEDGKTNNDSQLAHQMIKQPQQHIPVEGRDPQQQEENLSWTLFPGWGFEANKSRIALAYYQHYGNETLGYAGVPVGWGSRPYIWVPGALMSHHISRYRSVLEEWTGDWVQDFVRLDPINDDDATTDDDYDTPPFDDFPEPLADH